MTAERPDTALEVSGVRCHLGDRTVLDGVDLRVPSGRLLTLVGPSGCGKSTLLRAIAGLQPLDAGTVCLAGRDVSGAPPERRGIGLVFQDHALFGHLRVDRNIAFGLRHLPGSERRQRVDEMLDLVRLGHLARRFPHQLSGGEQQRVALARALAPRPAVVLLDEPFGALDEVLREELGWEVRDILARRHTAAVLVTHDRHEALTLGDEVAVMEQGRILQCAAPQIVYEQPATRFVADFLGVSSYVPSPTGTVVLARPHHLRVEPGSSHTVLRVEFLGSTHRYTLRADDGSVAVADHGPSRPLVVGERCTVRVVEGSALRTVD